MTTIMSRSQVASLDEGATDGKYRKARPDTEVAMHDADAKIMAERATLNPWMNYGYATQQSPALLNPGK
jgi:hypothetical protein